jgi:hypothetical protein
MTPGVRNSFGPSDDTARENCIILSFLIRQLPNRAFFSLLTEIKISRKACGGVEIDLR